MINHIRTMLMNEAASVDYLSQLGAELIDPHYMKKTLPGVLGGVHRVLFGTTPDRHLLNYRSHQLLSVIEASTLRKHVTDLDSRITYDLKLPTFFDVGLYEPQVVRPVGTGELLFAGMPAPPDKSGQTEYNWTLYVVDASNVRMTLLQPLQAVTNSYTRSGGLSNQQAIPWLTGQSVAFNGANGSIYNVLSRVRPTWDTAELLSRLESLGAAIAHQVFGLTSGKTKIEPHKTFYNVWEESTSSTDKLAAFVLAFANRVNEV